MHESSIRFAQFTRKYGSRRLVIWRFRLKSKVQDQFFCKCNETFDILVLFPVAFFFS